MFNEEILNFFVDMKEDLPKLLKTAPSEGALKWGITRGNEEDLYIDFKKHVASSGIPICFDSFCQAINFCINSGFFAVGFPNPMNLDPEETYYDFSNIVAVDPPVEESIVLVDTSRFPEDKKIYDYIKSFRAGKDSDVEFGVVAEEDTSIDSDAAQSLDIAEISRPIYLKTKGLEKYGFKEISTKLSIPIMVSVSFLCYLAEQFSTGAMDQDTVALIGQVLLDPKEAPVDMDQVRCDDYDDTLFFDIWPNDEIYSIFDIFYDEDDDEDDDPYGYGFGGESKKYEM